MVANPFLNLLVVPVTLLKSVFQLLLKLVIDAPDAQLLPGLLELADVESQDAGAAGQVTVARAFLQIAAAVACHREPVLER